MWIDWVDLRILGNSHITRTTYGNPVALSTLVQESFLAAEPQWYVLGITVAADTSDDLLGVDGEYQSWIFDDIERTHEKRGLQVLIQLNQAEGVFC